MEFAAQFIINSLIAASLYAIVALSFNLMYATGKFFNLAIGGLVSIGAYGVFLVSKQLGMPLALGIVAGVLVAGCAGLALDRFVYAPLRQKKASSMIMLIASLGAFTALQAVLAMAFTSGYQSLPRISPRIYDVFGGTITAVQVLIVVSAAALTLAVLGLLKWTSFGKAVRAMSDDVEMSKIAGIHTEKIFATVFFFASALAGYAGALLGLDVGIDPLMGFLPMLSGITSAVIGGIGEVAFGLFASYIHAFVQHTAVVQLSTEWSSSITYALLIMFLLFRPHGLFRK